MGVEPVGNPSLHCGFSSIVSITNEAHTPTFDRNFRIE